MPHNLSQSIQEFNSLSIIDDTKNRLNQEKQKLKLIQEVEAQMKQDLQLRHALKIEEEHQQESKLKKMLKHSFYYFLLIFGLFEDGAGSYLFGQSLFALIPGISNPALIVASILYTVFDCILFYAFEVSILKEALGIPFTTSDAHQLIKTYQEQLKTAIAINKHLATLPVLTLTSPLYEDYVRFAQTINEDLRQKNQAMKAYEESIPKKILKYAVLAFGTLSSIAGSYFMANTFMMMWAASLIATPVGWLIIGLTITAGLGFYYAMGARGMARLVNPDYGVFQELKKEFNEFEKEYEHHLENNNKLKASLEEQGTIARKKVMVDAETQTEPALQEEAQAEPIHQGGYAFFPAPKPLKVNEAAPAPAFDM